MYHKGEYDNIFKQIKYYLNSIFNKKDNIFPRRFHLNKLETIYFYLQMMEFGFNIEMKGTTEYIFDRLDIKNYRLLNMSRIYNYERFGDQFQNFSFKQNNIDKFYISKIEQIPSLYNAFIYKYSMSDNVKKYFEYLDHANNFDLI